MWIILFVLAALMCPTEGQALGRVTAVRWVITPHPSVTPGSAGTPAPARTPPPLARGPDWEPDWDALANHDYTSIGGTKQTPLPPEPVPVWPIFLTVGLLVVVPALAALGALWAVVRVVSGAWHAGARGKEP